MTEETLQREGNLQVVQQEPYYDDYDDARRAEESQRAKRKLRGNCEVYSSLAAALSAVSVGSLVGWTSAVTIKFIEEPEHLPFKMSKPQLCLGVSLLPLGATIGALFSASFTQALGRKLALQCTAFPCIVGWVMLLLGESVWWLYIARILGGIAMGTTYTVAIVYIAEICRPSIRGSCCCLVQVGFTIGLLYSYIVSIVSKRSFHPMTAACLPLPFIAAVLLQLAPETPQYLIHTQQLVKAAKILQRVRGAEEDIEDEFADMLIAEGEQDTQGMFQIKHTRKAFYITVGLMVFQQLTGIYNVYMNLEHISTTTGIFDSTAITAAVLTAVMLVFASIAAGIIDLVGRKILLYASIGAMSGMALVVLICVVVQHYMDSVPLEWIFFLSLMMYACAYNVGLGPLPWIIVAEMMPQRYRPSACGLASANGWIILTLSTACYCWIPSLIANYALYTIFSILGVVYIHYVLPETKGLTQEEIHEILER